MVDYMQNHENEMKMNKKHQPPIRKKEQKARIVLFNTDIILDC